MAGWDWSHLGGGGGGLGWMGGGRGGALAGLGGSGGGGGGACPLGTQPVPTPQGALPPSTSCNGCCDDPAAAGGGGAPPPGGIGTGVGGNPLSPQGIMTPPSTGGGAGGGAGGSGGTAQACADAGGDPPPCTPTNTSPTPSPTLGPITFPAVTMSYSVDLSGIQDDAIIESVTVTYRLHLSFGTGSPSSYLYSDLGGSTTSGSGVINWGPAGIASVRAALLSDSLSVSASCAYVITPNQQNQLEIVSFVVSWCPAVK